jgi:ABC-2 type transport system ATP-binding protein
LLLDEPTNGVDPVSRREFWRLLYDLNRDGTTVLVSSSYMDEAERAVKFILLHGGSIIAEGVPNEARANFDRAIYEVRAPNLRELKEGLRALSEFDSVTVFGDSLHLAAAMGVSDDAIRALVSSTGLPYESVARIVPSFEDIYIGLSRESKFSPGS